MSVIGEILGINPIGDDEYLCKQEETMVGPVAMTLIPVDLIEGFFEFNPSSFEFDLNQRQAIDEEGDIIAIGIGAFLSDLTGDLIQIITGLFAIKESDVAG